MKTLIEQLNKMALYHSDADIITTIGIDRVIKDFGLEFVAGDENCRIYKAADGTLINCWIEAAFEDWLGFDDQIEWFVDDLITQAEAVELGAPSIQAVNNAIRDGRLRGYNNPDAEYQRQGKTLVSRAEIQNLW